jgi:hypothetical protein
MGRDQSELFNLSKPLDHMLNTFGLISDDRFVDTLRILDDPASGLTPNFVNLYGFSLMGSVISVGKLADVKEMIKRGASLGGCQLQCRVHCSAPRGPMIRPCGAGGFPIIAH